jgi:hypothetical protein
MKWDLAMPDHPNSHSQPTAAGSASSRVVQERLEDLLRHAPALRPYLETMFKRYASRGKLPKTMTLGPHLPAADLLALRHCFGVRHVTPAADGKVRVQLERFLKDSSTAAEFWLAGLGGVLGLNRSVAATPGEGDEFATLLDRLRLQHASLSHLLGPVFDRPALRRKHAARPEALAEQLDRLCRGAAELLTSPDFCRLSNLGVQLFNDSKALRKGTENYNLLGNLLCEFFGEDLPDRETAYERCGVGDNPTAVKVTVYGPFTYLRRGRLYHWPRELWEVGEPAVLSLANLREISEIRLPATAELITCENETPFNDLIQAIPGAALLYTAGYPNSAVRQFLRKLGPLAAPLRHWGDSDPDGYLIAQALAAIQPLRLWRCDLRSLQQACGRLRPLTGTKLARGRRLLENHPDFPFAAELRYALEHGWLEQEAWQFAEGMSASR